jgi:D-3-phosphoglycerate dehydrogenase
MNEQWTVLLPEPIEEEAKQLLIDSGLKVVQSPGKDPAVVGPLMADADAVVLRTGIKMTPELIAQGKKLKTISRTGAGFDNVDLKAATEHGVIVSSSLGVNTTTVPNMPWPSSSPLQAASHPGQGNPQRQLQDRYATCPRHTKK